MFIHRIFTYQYQSLKNIHFIVYPINCYIFVNEKSCLTSKHMHNAEIRTVAKLLPLLRKNTHKSLILSYSEYLGRIFKKNMFFTHTQKCNFLAIHLRNTLLCQRLFLFKLYFCSRKINEASKTVAI